jgi:C4-dicarboxylate-specific signal transduction histidine kinase
MQLLAHREQDPAMASDGPNSGKDNRLKVCAPKPLNGDGMVHLARLAMVGELAASLIHEITQPVAAMLVDAEAGRNWMRQGTNGLTEARFALERVTDQGNRVAAIIAQMRSLTRKCDPMLETVFAQDLVSEALVLVKPEGDRRGVTIEWTVDADTLSLEVDRVQIVQVLMNLLTNALQASQPGAKVRVRCRATPEGVEFRIDDNGPGVGGGNLARLFDPFFSTKQDGLGLGLGICRSIVECHGGHIWADSQVGEGTSFFFTIPHVACRIELPTMEQACLDPRD